MSSQWGDQILPKCTIPTEMYRTEFGAGFVDQSTYDKYYRYPLLPGMETDRCRLILTDLTDHTGVISVLDLVTCTPMLCTQGRRLTPKIEIDHYSDRSGNTESHRADFGASFADPFTYVAYTSALTNTKVRNRSLSVNLNLLSDPGGETDSYRNARTPTEM